MVKKTFTFINHNGQEVTETHYFDLNESEVIEMELTTEGGLQDTIKKITDAKSSPELFKLFKEFVLKCHGEKSADGNYFYKSEETRHKFACSIPYNMLVVEFLKDTNAAIKFFNEVIPKGSLNANNTANTTAIPAATN